MYPELRLASRTDIPAMLEIEQLSFSCPWDWETLSSCIGSPACRTWTARMKGVVRGYVSACLETEGLHIVNLAVHPSYRRKGLASALLDTAEGWGERLGAVSALLEVRTGAVAARELYDQRAYRELERLEGYYPDGEDGLLLVRSLVPREDTAAMAWRIMERCGKVPATGVVLGSGLSWLAEESGIRCSLDYGDVMEESSSQVPGHPGRLVFSECGRFVFLLGRRHHYQGYSDDQISVLPGILGDLGVSRWILTSSSGAVDPSLKPGDAVLFRDHVNFTGCVPSSGPWRIRPSVYSRLLAAAARDAALESGTVVREGLFACVSGPAYETSAEIEFLNGKGFSTVSMSTVPEALLLSSMGFEVSAVSLITNEAAPGAVLTHEEVLASQGRVHAMQGKFMSAFLRKAASFGLQ
ncbi:MAG: GNAT family N-acetyltransferase [Candidatus Fermentibacteraceae bacterium]|nr:GNAT family N-acetyltransferase [Candidatus Fermentibacteraceae bacterium]MBN2608431.1 GNAT family N-acetyltransferase [Candidatus Fermentibacteraceae bacterium]